MSTTEWLCLAGGAVLSGLLLAVGHWFPWPRRLRRMEAYTYGVGSIWVGFSLWRVLVGDWVVPLGLGLICVASGFATWSAYGVDTMTRAIRQARMAEEMDGELSSAE